MFHLLVSDTLAIDIASFISGFYAYADNVMARCFFITDTLGIDDIFCIIPGLDLLEIMACFLCS